MIVDIIFGFLGSGKTTFITRVLKEWGDKEKIVVLVNEFGDVGIDGDLLRERGGNVVEMPSGCICCTLQGDFRTQMLEIIDTFQPQRLIIEPTGVATIAQIRSIVEAQLFENVIDEINHTLIADATGFMGLYKANRHFIESQVKNARIVLLNKCDKVDARRAVLTRNAISAINPEATVLMTEHGAVDWVQYTLALSTPPASGQWQGNKDSVDIHQLEQQEEFQQSAAQEIHLLEEQDALGYESFGLVYDDVSFDQGALEALFRELNASRLGEVVRAKGIFRVENRCILMELASGEFNSQPLRLSDQSKISIIGRNLDKKRIGASLEDCVLRADKA
jgi:G3E family GTPase